MPLLGSCRIQQCWKLSFGFAAEFDLYEASVWATDKLGKHAVRNNADFSFFFTEWKGGRQTTPYELPTWWQQSSEIPLYVLLLFDHKTNNNVITRNHECWCNSSPQTPNTKRGTTNGKTFVWHLMAALNSNHRLWSSLPCYGSGHRSSVYPLEKIVWMLGIFVEKFQIMFNLRWRWNGTFMTRSHDNKKIPEQSPLIRFNIHISFHLVSFRKQKRIFNQWIIRMERQTHVDAEVGPREDLGGRILSWQVPEEFVRSLVPLERVERWRVRSVRSVVQATQHHVRPAQHLHRHLQMLNLQRCRFCSRKITLKIQLQQPDDHWAIRFNNKIY